MHVRASGLGKIAVGLALLWASMAPACAADVTGIWWTPDKDGKIELRQEANGTLTGHIIAVQPSDAKTLDPHNPSPALRGRHLLGLPFMSGFAKDGQGQWINGKIYDPDSGSTYDAKLWLEGADRLMVRGFLGLSFLGKTETFRRVGGPAPATQQPGEPTLTHLRR